MNKLNIAIIGYGNVARAAACCVKSQPDMTLAGYVNARRAGAADAEGAPIAAHIDALAPVDAALLCLPSRAVVAAAEPLLERGIVTADCFDEHQYIGEVWARLNAAALKGNTAAVTAAGWDPGLDSAIRALFMAAAPRGVTYTNFGPGMSMGHSVVARAMEGVKNALSLTIPKGTGLHRRMVYVELYDKADFARVEAAIKNDPHFAHDETYVTLVEDVTALADMGHGVSLTRKGVSGAADNQMFTFDMRVNNPALTAQLMTAGARAASRQRPGCYTMIELPPVDLLPGGRETWREALV